MKRLALFLFFSLFLLSFSSADEQGEDLKNLLDFSITLEKLSNLDPAGLDKLISQNKFILMDGTISAITEIERSDDNLILDIHLVSGQWEGLDRVVSFKSIININGKEWEPRFPKRVPRNITDDLILQNDRILVIGKVSSYVMDDSELRPVVDALLIRKIQ